MIECHAAGIQHVVILRRPRAKSRLGASYRLGARASKDDWARHAHAHVL